MYITDLKKGDEVILQITMNGQSFEVTSVVCEMLLNKPYIQPFVFKGVVLDFSNKIFKNATFDLFINGKDSKRMCFKNVSLELTKHQGKPYYIVMSNGFRAMAEDSDRRTHERMKLHLSADLTVEGEFGTKNVRIYDISDNGIAFTSQFQMALTGKKCHLEFSDILNNNRYELKVDCRCVRDGISKEGQFLYGCKIDDASHQMLAYVYIYKIIGKSMENGGGMVIG